MSLVGCSRRNSATASARRSVDNRPGAMTQIGADALNRASPDGYTLMIVTSEATMLPFLKKSYHYDPVKDFTPIALLATSWTVFAVNPKVPANTLAELIAYSKANPGRVRYGSGGVGGALHIAVEMLRLKTAPTSCTFPIAAADRRRATRSPDRSRWCRLGWRARASPSRGRCAAHPRPNRTAAASDVRRCADHRRARDAGRAHGYLVRPARPTPYARADRRPLGARERRRGEPRRFPREVVSHRLRRGMDAADGVWHLHAR